MSKIRIADPCSVEREDQIDVFLQHFSNYNIDYFREGIWKAMALNNQFERVGEAGLVWLSNAINKYNIPIAIEVRTPKHVKLAIKNNIECVCIGSSKSASPFTVSELIDAIKGSKTKVRIKNSINPDINSLTGTIHELISADCNVIGLIHRGFYTHESFRFRNEPIWSILEKVMQLFPNIPVLCDPSHITGEVSLIPQLINEVNNMCDGIMIKVHENPKKVWTDANQ